MTNSSHLFLLYTLSSGRDKIKCTDGSLANISKKKKEP